MQGLTVFASVMTVLIIPAVFAFAVAPGKRAEYEGGGAGKIIFRGDDHKQFGCDACHPGLFKMRDRDAAMTMKEMYRGAYCGACHDGTTAFGVKEAAACARCHKRYLSPSVL